MDKVKSFLYKERYVIALGIIITVIFARYLTKICDHYIEEPWATVVESLLAMLFGKYVLSHMLFIFNRFLEKFNLK